jgi:hypothetical protein
MNGIGKRSGSNHSGDDLISAVGPRRTSTWFLVWMCNDLGDGADLEIARDFSHRALTTAKSLASPVELMAP